MVVLHVDVAVRVDHRGDPDLAPVDELRGEGIGTVVREEVIDEVERDLDRHQLAGVVEPHDQDLRLLLVELDVVRDLEDEEVPALDARPYRVELRDRGVGGLQGHELRYHLVIGMVEAEVLVEVQGDRLISPLEDRCQYALRRDPIEVLIGRCYIDPAVPVDVEHVDVSFDEVLVRQLLGELRSHQVRPAGAFRVGGKD